MKNFVYNVTSFESPQSVKFVGDRVFDSYCVELSDPFSLSFSVETPSLIAGQDSYVVLKSASGFGFSPDLVCLCSGETIKPHLVSSDFLVIPVNKVVGTYTFEILGPDGSESFDVEFVSVLDSSVDFAFTASRSFTFFAGVTRKVLLEVEKACAVSRITAAGVSVPFTFVDDTHIIFDLKLDSFAEVILYDALGTVLTAVSVLVPLNQTEDIEVFVAMVGGVGYLFSDFLPEGTVLVTVGSSFVPPLVSFHSFYTSTTEDVKNAFTFIVRGKGGAVVPNTAYRVYSDNFNMTGYSDCNGVISIPFASLPNVFTLCFSSYDLTFLSQTFCKVV